MSVDQRVAENVQRGIALLTAWNESDDGDTELVDAVAADQLADDQDPSRVVGGLVSVAGVLLVRLSYFMGVSEREILRELARHVSV